MKEKAWEYSSLKRPALKDYLEPTKSSKGSKLPTQGSIGDSSTGIRRKEMDNFSGSMGNTTLDNGERVIGMVKGYGSTVKATATMENGPGEGEKDTVSISQKVASILSRSLISRRFCRLQKRRLGKRETSQRRLL